MYPVFWHDIYASRRISSRPLDNSSFNMTDGRSANSPLALGVSFGVLCLVMIYILVICLIDFMRTRQLCPGSSSQEEMVTDIQEANYGKEVVPFCGKEGGDSNCVLIANGASGRGCGEQNDIADRRSQLDKCTNVLVDERNQIENVDRAERHKSEGVPSVPNSVNTNRYFSNGFEHRQEDLHLPIGESRPKQTQIHACTVKSSSDETLHRCASKQLNSKDIIFPKISLLDQRLCSSLKFLPTVTSSSWPDGINALAKLPSGETCSQTNKGVSANYHGPVNQVASVNVFVKEPALTDSGFCPSRSSSDVNGSRSWMLQCTQNDNSNSYHAPIRSA